MSASYSWTYVKVVDIWVFKRGIKKELKLEIRHLLRILKYHSKPKIRDFGDQFISFSVELLKPLCLFFYCFNSQDSSSGTEGRKKGGLRNVRNS